MSSELCGSLAYAEQRSAATIAEEIAFASSAEAGLTPEESVALIADLSIELAQYQLAESFENAPWTMPDVSTESAELEQTLDAAINKHVQMPQLKSNQVIRALGRTGIIPIGQTGSHMKLKGEETGVVIVPVHKGRDIKRGTLGSIIAQAGLTQAGFLALL